MAAEGIPVEIDPTKARAFAGRLSTALSDAAAGDASIPAKGHRIGTRADSYTFVAV